MKQGDAIMTIRKRAAAAVLASLVCLGTLAGCGKTEEARLALPPFRPKSVQLSNILSDGRAFRLSSASSPAIRR